MANTPFERIWDRHVVKDYGDGRNLVFIDRHFLQEATSGRAFDRLRAEGIKVRRPDLTVGTIDHSISTMPGRTLNSYAAGVARNVPSQSIRANENAVWQYIMNSLPSLEPRSREINENI